MRTIDYAKHATKISELKLIAEIESEIENIIKKSSLKNPKENYEIDESKILEIAEPLKDRLLITFQKSDYEDILICKNSNENGSIIFIFDYDNGEIIFNKENIKNKFNRGKQ